MTISKADRYTEISRYLLEESRSQLDRGDLIQASEKAWGATAHAIKSLAQTRGWNHTRHDLLADVVDQISDEWDRAHLQNLFRSANYLHNNFYEHAMPPTQVRGAINDAAALIEELHTLRQATTSALRPRNTGPADPPPKADPPPTPHRRRHKRPAPRKTGPTARGGLTAQSRQQERRRRQVRQALPRSQVTMSLQDMFWGSYFGSLTDRFGINWMVSYTPPQVG